MENADAPAETSRDFYDAQSYGGDNYFLYIIQEGEHEGGGTSCYFWFSSPSQLLASIKNHMDFWEWAEGWEEASAKLAEIIDSHADATSLGDKLVSQLDHYAYENAGIKLWALGTFEDLCSGHDAFCVEARTDFRGNGDWDDENSDEANGDPSRPISEDEIDEFIEFLGRTAT